MSKYELTIQLATDDVHQINGVNQKVIIVKEVGGTSGSQVAWVSFSPFETNVVQWEEEYGIYASSIEVQESATIIKTSAVNPATSGVFYPFETGAFGAPTGDAGENNYGIENKYSQQFTFGMAQSVTANGSKFNASPLNAVQVLSQQKVQFKPIEKVQLFLQGNYNNGVIIASIASKGLEVDLTSNPNVIIHYDKTQGKFILGPL
jgi:hypothetical protein